MSTTAKVIRYALLTVAILSLLGLIGWYMYLRTHSNDTETVDLARGLSETAPSFTGNTGSTYQNVMTEVTSGSSSGEGAGQLSQLWHASINPAAGVGFLSGSATALFVERATGYVFSADPTTGAITRLTNTLMPKVYDALVSNKALFLRSVDESGRITTFSASIPTVASTDEEGATSTLRQLSGGYLTEDIISIAVHPSTSEIFYLLNDANAGPIGIRAQSNGSQQKRVFTSGILGWNVKWPSSSRIVLVQKPIDSLPGYAYKLEADGTLSPIIGSIPGLTLLPHPTSDAFLYGASGSSLALFAQSSPGATPIPLPIRTVADKCVWAREKDIAYCAVPQTIASSNFLRDWYMGATHTSDAWWRVDTADGTAEILYSPGSSNVSIDVEKPVLDASGAYIAFLDANDKSVWILRIKQ